MRPDSHHRPLRLPFRTIRAFSLFEVAIGLALVSVAAVTMLMLFPTGIRGQQRARFELYAATKALEMIDAFCTFPTANPSLEVEAPNPWDVAVSRGNQAFDLERRLASARFGIMPLPLAIARRIDSDGDEIRTVLDQGGYLYYAQPLATTGFTETAAARPPASEAQRLVFAVIGNAQLNAMPIFPWKAWPYYAPWPSPPCHGTHAPEDGFSLPPGTPRTDFPAGGRVGYGGFKPGVLWEHTSDPDLEPVFAHVRDGIAYGYRPHLIDATADTARRYCQTALWYAHRKGLPRSYYDDDDIKDDFAPATPEDERWMTVNAFRLLSHAATCLTTFHDRAALDAGVPIVSIDLLGDGTASEALTIDTARVESWHESAMRLAMLFAASHPYDWAVPRPLNRAIMMDHPLIESDCFSSPLAGMIWGTSERAEQWRPLPATPIRHIGRSFQFPSEAIPSVSGRWPWSGGDPVSPARFWGDPTHVTLTARFDAAERCRQLVFWSADWLAYRDAETCPSAPVDAGRYPRGAPRLRPDMAGPDPFVELMRRPPLFDWQQYAFRNPEKSWRSAVTWRTARPIRPVAMSAPRSSAPRASRPDATIRARTSMRGRASSAPGARIAISTAGSIADCCHRRSVCTRPPSRASSSTIRVFRSPCAEPATMHRLRAFTLLEMLIAIALGMMIVYIAVAGLRAAIQASTIANRLSLENCLFRSGYWAVVDEVDFWRMYDDPESDAQPLRRFDPARGRGLPFTPLKVTRFRPRAESAASGDEDAAREAERGWDAAYQWPAADSRTWYHGNLVECVDTTQHVFGHYELFAHLADAWTPLTLNRSYLNGSTPPFGLVEPRHTWWFNQVEGLKDALGYYAVVDYCPADAIYGVYGDAGPDLELGTADDEPQSLSREWCRPEGEGGGVVWRFANNDGGTRWPRGIYRHTRDSSYPLVPASRWTEAGTDSWPVAALVEHNARSWPTSRVTTVTSGVPDLLAKARLQCVQVPLRPASWPEPRLSAMRFLTYSRFAAVFTIGWTSPVTGQSIGLSFSALGTSLRGARQQRSPDSGWAAPGDPNLDSY